MAEQTLTADNWRARKKKPKVVSLRTLGDAKVILRPLSAFQRMTLEKSLAEETSSDRLFAAVVAESFVSGEIDGETVVNLGPPIWKAEELIGDDFPGDTLKELSDALNDYLGEGSRKN